MGCWTIQPGGSWVGKTCPGVAGWHGQHRGGRQLALEGFVGFSHTSLIHKRSMALPWGSSKLCHEVGGRQQGSPSFCLVLSKHQQGKQRGWNCSSEENISDKDPFSFSWIGTNIFPAPAAWTALAFTSRLCRHRRPIQAARHIWLTSGDRERETRQSSSRWDKGFQSEMGSKKRAEIRGTTSLLSRKRNTPESFSTAILGDQGKVKAWSTLKQKPSAGTKRSKTHILQRGQPAPQEMHSIWPNKSIQSS